MTFFLYQMGAFLVWFLYGSFFEWVFHKYLFHSPKIIRATYEAHGVTHHNLYNFADSYDMPSPEDPGGHHIKMDWFALPLFLAVHFPLIWAVQWLTGIPMLWGGLAAIAAYYLVYETVHFFMHVPRSRRLEQTRWFKFVNDHHRIHHKNHNVNLNVFFPLADFVLRTKRTYKSHVKASPPQELVRAPKTMSPVETVAKRRRTQE